MTKEDNICWNVFGKSEHQSVGIIRKSLISMLNVVLIMTRNQKPPNSFSRWYKT